jgi:hypothetical protein
LAQTQIAEKIGAARQTVNNSKQSFIAAESISDFLQRRKRGTSPVAPKITGEAEAPIPLAVLCRKGMRSGQSTCRLINAWNCSIPIQSRLSPFNGF